MWKFFSQINFSTDGTSSLWGVCERTHKACKSLLWLNHLNEVGHSKTPQTFCFSGFKLSIFSCRWQEKVSDVFQGSVEFSLPAEIWIPSLRVPKIQPASGICPFVLSIPNCVTLSIRMILYVWVLIIYYYGLIIAMEVHLGIMMIGKNIN